MLEKSGQQSTEQKVSAHFLKNPMTYNLLPMEPAKVKIVLESAEDYSQNRIMDITGQESYQEAFEMIKKSNKPGGSCSRKIGDDDISWYCKTCQLGPNSIYCTDCFKNGNHSGHNIASLKELGGRCDCGDYNSFKKEGYCSHHTGENIDEFKLSDFTCLEQAEKAIRRAVRALQHLSLQIDTVPSNFATIMKSVRFLRNLAEHNNYCVQLIVKELGQVSRSPHYKHFPSVFSKDECNHWVYSELAAFDPWFKQIQQQQAEQGKEETPGDTCQCLRLDNLLKMMFRLDYPQKQEVNDLVFVLCRSVKFRVMATVSLCANLHYCEFKQISPYERGFDVFYNLGYQMFPEKEAELCFLKSQTTLKAFQTAFYSSINFYKDESNVYRESYFDGLLGYLNVIFSNRHEHPPLTYLNFYKLIIRVFRAADLPFSYPYNSGDKYSGSIMPEMLRIMGMAKGAEQMALNMNKLPPASQIQLYKLLSVNLIELCGKFEPILETGLCLFMPSLFLASFLISNRMLPYVFSRLKGKKIVIDPLFKDLLDPNFSNKVLEKVFNSEKAAILDFALPKPWTAENVGSLAPFDLLFHYTVNTLQPLLGLTADQETYSKAIRYFQLLGSLLWKVGYQLRFNPMLFSHQIKMQLFQILFVNRLPDFPFLLNLFECVHQAAIILAQAPLYHERLQKSFDQNYTLLIFLEMANKMKLGENDPMKLLQSCWVEVNNFAFYNPFALYQSMFPLMATKQYSSKKQAEMCEFIAERLFKMELFFNFGTLRIVNIPFLEMPVLTAGIDAGLRSLVNFQSLLKKYVNIQELPQSMGQQVLVLKDQFVHQMNLTFQYFQTPEIESFLQLMQKMNPTQPLGHFSTQHKYGIRSLPIFAEMRPIASAVNIDLLKRNLARKTVDDQPPISIGSLHTLFLCKLYSIGIEGRHQVHMPPKEEEIKEIQDVLARYLELPTANKQLLGGVGDRLSAFMKNRHSEDKVDVQEEQTKEGGLLSSLMNPFHNEALFKGKCGICLHLCTEEDEKPFGYACFIGSNNFVSKAQLAQIASLKEKEGDTSFNKQEWAKALQQGQFFVKPSSRLVHYHCIQALSHLDRREFAVTGAYFNCVISQPSGFKIPSADDYGEFKDPNKIYFKPHPSLAFIGTLLENYNSLHQPSIQAQTDKIYAFPGDIKNYLPKLPMIISEIISDNVALAVCIRGLVPFLKECQSSTSPTLACIENMKKVFEFFSEKVEDHLDQAISQPTSAGLLQYGHKIERYFGNLVVWKDELDSDSSQRIKLIFQLYGQLWVEMKGHEGKPPEISRTDLLKLVQIASALVLTRYKMSALNETIKKLQTLEGEEYFNYLWEDILGLNPLVIGVFTNKVVTASQVNPILPEKEAYFEQKQLRALFLASHPLKLSFIPLPEDFVQFQARYYERKCTSCDSIPKIPAVCGFCEQIVCLNTQCCGVGILDEGFAHAFTCGYGTGIFFVVQSSDIRISIAASRTNNRLLSTPYRNALGQCADQKLQHYALQKKVLNAIEKKISELQTHLP